MIPDRNRRKAIGVLGGVIIGGSGLMKLVALGDASEKVDLRVINGDTVDHRFHIEVTEGARSFTGTATLEPESSYVFESALASGSQGDVSKLTVDVDSRKSVGYNFKIEPETDVFEIEYRTTGRVNFQQRR